MPNQLYITDSYEWLSAIPAPGVAVIRRVGVEGLAAHGLAARSAIFMRDKALGQTVARRLGLTPHTNAAILDVIVTPGDAVAVAQPDDESPSGPVFTLIELAL